MRIVDLPFEPFRGEDRTERHVIDHIANRVIGISNNERRMAKDGREWGKTQHFGSSKCLVGIDVSNIGAPMISYLENLALLTYIHPSVLLNCSLDSVLLKGLKLHRLLRDMRYILPVFSRLPPLDGVLAKRRYGQAFVDLLEGKSASVPVQELTGLGDMYSLAELTLRFPGLSLSEGSVTYSPQIRWLGVDSAALSAALTYLFNQRKKEFCISDVCEKHGASEELMLQYARRSMLFQYSGGDHARFRLQRHRVLPEAMRALLEQCEEEMISRRVIDTRSTDYRHFKSLTEYHRVGRLFQAQDTFALKLLSYVRQCFAAHLHGDEENDVPPMESVDCIVVLDNGYEHALRKLLENLEWGGRVIRLINYYDTPVVPPFEGLKGGERVFLIADIVSEGGFFRDCVAVLRNIGCKIAGAFAFVISADLDTRSLFGDVDESTPDFHYYVKKELAPVHAIVRLEHVTRFERPGEDSFLLFWDFADRHMSVRTELREDRAPLRPNEPGGTRSYSLQRFRLPESDAGVQLSEDESFCRFIARAMTHHRSDCVVVTGDDTDPGFAEACLRASGSSGTVRRLEDRLQGIERPLLLVPSLALGFRTYDLVQRTREACGPGASVGVVAVVHGRQAFGPSHALHRGAADRLTSRGIPVWVFYRSRLPFYVATDEQSFVRDALAVCTLPDERAV